VNRVRDACYRRGCERSGFVPDIEKRVAGQKKWTSRFLPTKEPLGQGALLSAMAHGTSGSWQSRAAEFRKAWRDGRERSSSEGLDQVLGRRDRAQALRIPTEARRLAEAADRNHLVAFRDSDGGWTLHLYDASIAG